MFEGDIEKPKAESMKVDLQGLMHDSVNAIELKETFKIKGISHNQQLQLFLKT